eukprot:Gb_19946 [translate_table: standard]
MGKMLGMGTSLLCSPLKCIEGFSLSIQIPNKNFGILVSGSGFHANSNFRITMKKLKVIKLDYSIRSVAQDQVLTGIMK